MDLTTLTDEELCDQINAIIAEQNRRESLNAIPQQISDLVSQYVSSGGDVSNLPSEVTPPA